MTSPQGTNELLWGKDHEDVIILLFDLVGFRPSENQTLKIRYTSKKSK